MRYRCSVDEITISQKHSQTQLIFICYGWFSTTCFGLYKGHHQVAVFFVKVNHTICNVSVNVDVISFIFKKFTNKINCSGTDVKTVQEWQSRSLAKQEQIFNLIFVVPSIMLYSSEISPTRCNNCVFILRNGITIHVSGDNLTHHQEYICCIWPQVSRLT